MNHGTIPVRSEHYIQQQLALARLLDLPDGQGRIPALSIEEELEAEFTLAWGLSPDPSEPTLEMGWLADSVSSGFDHCTYFHEPKTNAQVIVTQPYLEPREALELLTNTLSLGDRKPDIIPAHEWGFYYPNYATLVVVKFPPGYQTILRALNRLRSQDAQSHLEEN